jgi:hypothetical protein
MTRFALTAVAMLGMVSIAAQDASALTAKNRLCVQSARARARSAVSTVRQKALLDQRTDIIACFGPGDCASKCTSDQTTCLENRVTAPRSLCDTSNDPADSTVSCRETFDAAVAACRTQFPGRTPADIDKQLACLSAARSARFTCSQACAAAVQPEQDTCGTNFSDCLEGCG